MKNKNETKMNISSTAIDTANGIMSAALLTADNSIVCPTNIAKKTNSTIHGIVFFLYCCAKKAHKRTKTSATTTCIGFVKLIIGINTSSFVLIYIYNIIF